MTPSHAAHKALDEFYSDLPGAFDGIAETYLAQEHRAVWHKSVSLLSMAELCLDKKRFNLEHLYKLAQIFDCDICEFFKPIEATQSTDIDTAPASNQQN